MSATRLLSELHPDTLGRHLAAGAPLLLPIGTVEWHSHHLPLGLDGIKAEALALAAADRCNAVVAPTCWWAAGGVPHPYTLRLPADLVTPLLTEALVQYIGFGFTTVAIVNGHYGLDNSVVVRQAALACSERTGATVIPVADYEALLSLGARGDHAGIWETSLLWAARPDLVAVDALVPGQELPGIVGDDPRGRASHELGVSGVEAAAQKIADVALAAAAADAEDRQQLLDALAASLTALETIQELRGKLPRSEVPPVATRAWLDHLDAFLAGRYNDAMSYAAEKARDPSS